MIASAEVVEFQTNSDVHPSDDAIEALAALLLDITAQENPTNVLQTEK